MKTYQEFTKLYENTDEQKQMIIDDWNLEDFDPDFIETEFGKSRFKLSLQEGYYNVPDSYTVESIEWEDYGSTGGKLIITAFKK